MPGTLRRLRSGAIAALAISTGFFGSTAASPVGETVYFDRPDGARLVGTFAAVGERARPAVLLLHQAQSSREEFDFLLPALHELGFNTLAVDLRGHGESTKPEVIDRAFFATLFTNPDLAPPDVEAMLAWLAKHPRVDASRIAVVGGSLGANLSYVASGADWGVKTAVAISGHSVNANLLAANVENFAPHSVLVIAADGDGMREHHATAMFEQAGDPRRVEILQGSAAHGVSILAQSDEMKRIVLDWLSTQLGDTKATDADAEKD